jgi:hypothetical protein
MLALCLTYVAFKQMPLFGTLARGEASDFRMLIAAWRWLRKHKRSRTSMWHFFVVLCGDLFFPNIESLNYN